MSLSSAQDLRTFEYAQLVEAIYFRYGVDFREYAQASLSRHMEKFAKLSSLPSLSDLIPKLLYDPACFDQLMKKLSVSMTSMFLDPPVFKEIREKIIPLFKDHDQINILHLGCGTGEEVYSVAILLKEAGLLERAQIRAIDFNHHALEAAKSGIYPAYKVQEFTKNYKKSGGQASFSDYYVAKYNLAKFSEWLRQAVSFESASLTEPLAFDGIHIIFCRNVLIYFNKALHDRVLMSIEQSLDASGFLVLGARETLTFSQVANRFEVIAGGDGIFRKRHAL